MNSHVVLPRFLLAKFLVFNLCFEIVVGRHNLYNEEVSALVWLWPPSISALSAYRRGVGPMCNFSHLTKMG